MLPLEIISNAFESLNNVFMNLKSINAEYNALIKANANKKEIDRIEYLQEAMETLIFAESNKIKATATSIATEARDNTNKLHEMGLLLVTVFSLILTIVIGASIFLIYKRINLSLNHLKRSASTLETGNLDKPVPNLGSDEFGDLARVMDSMRISHKQVEAALRESENFLNKLVENIPHMIFVKEAKELRFVRFNKAGEELLGYSREELVGKNDYDFFPKEEADFFIEKDRDVLRNGECLDIPEESIQTKHKGKRSLHTKKLPILDKEGNPQYLLGISDDITERKQLQAQLQQAHKMESIGNLAGGIAHDFNNILSSVIGFTELALDDVEKGTNIEDSLQEVYIAGKRAKDLVAQILAFARQSEEKVKPIQVDAVVKEVLKFIRSSIPTTIEIKSNIDSDSPVMGNKTQVHQIMMNLCTNAAHAMEKNGGILDIKLKDIVIDKNYSNKKLALTYGNYIEISVSDTGTGIAPDILDSIFEPYFTTKGPGEGTGMGLAMVHGIVESYDGQITVDSALGKGTTFRIYLPITHKREIHRQYEVEQLPSGTERILFVDDEAPIAKMGGQGLERLGYKVTTRTSSVEALELFRSKSGHFDLVITDMTMPNMTGDKLAVELMKIRSDIPVILCTGYSKKISDETAAQLGIKAFAFKPVVKADLAKTVRKVLDEAKGESCA